MGVVGDAFVGEADDAGDNGFWQPEREDDFLLGSAFAESRSSEAAATVTVTVVLTLAPVLDRHA